MGVQSGWRSGHLCLWNINKICTLFYYTSIYKVSSADGTVTVLGCRI